LLKLFLVVKWTKRIINSKIDLKQFDRIIYSIII
jgi:hypothetical protein